MRKQCLFISLFIVSSLLTFSVWAEAEKSVWITDPTGVCRDDDGKYPRWSEYGWSLSQCRKACEGNSNCQGFAMSKTKEYCQLFGPEGAFQASKPGAWITRGHSSQPEYTCYIKHPYTTLSAFPYHELPVEIVNANSGKCMDVAHSGTENGSRIVQYTCNATKNQSWFLIYGGNNRYQIRPGNIGNKNLDVAGGNLEDGASIQIWDQVTNAQIFGFVAQVDGSHQIVSMNSGKCLDVPHGSTEDAVYVQQFSCNAGANQRWFIRVRTNPFNLIAKDSQKDAKDSQKCLDVYGASQADGANVQQYTCARTDNQGWNIEPAGVSNGLEYYSIRSRESGKCLDVYGASNDNGANIQQFRCTGADNQKWHIHEESDGYVSIRNKGSGKCADVNGASKDNNANVQQYTCTGGDNQRWFWSNFAERHLHVVQVANSAGQDRTLAVDSNVQLYVEHTNKIFGRYGIQLIYDPAQDKSNVDNNALFQLDSTDTKKRCPDGSNDKAMNCAKKYATKWPNKVVVFTRRGNGFSSGDASYIAIGEMKADMVCGDVPNTTWLAHEFGHYLGLTHPLVTVANACEGLERLKNAKYDPSIFDGDYLADTPPMPCWKEKWECIETRNPTTTVALDCRDDGLDCNVDGVNCTGGAIPFTVHTDNIMTEGYCYRNRNKRITPQQASIVRATSWQRGW